MNKNIFIVVILFLFITMILSIPTFKLGIYLDGMTVKIVENNKPAKGFLKRNDELLGIKLLTEEEKKMDKNYIGKSFTVEEDVPEEFLLKTDQDLDDVLKKVLPGDALLLWVRRGEMIKKMYIPSEKTLPKAPEIFIDTSNHRSLLQK